MVNPIRFEGVRRSSPFFSEEQSLATNATNRVVTPKREIKSIVPIKDLLTLNTQYDEIFHSEIANVRRKQQQTSQKTHIPSSLEQLLLDYSYSIGSPLSYLSNVSPSSISIENTLPGYQGIIRDLLSTAREKGLDLKPEDILITGQESKEEQIKKMQTISALRKALDISNWIPLEQMVSFVDTAKKIGEGSDQLYKLIADYFEPNHEVQRLLREEGRDVKDRFLQHAINNQSAEKYRSVIELVSNAIDSSVMANNSNLNIAVELNSQGYTVIDNGIGMNPQVILEKLLIPTVSGKTGDGTIGRFGIGFYTALSHLKTDQDFVRVITNTGEQAYQLTFQKRVERGRQISVSIQPLNNAPKGTKIEVKCADFEDEKARKYLEETMKFNTNAFIELSHNGKNSALNDLSKLEKIEIPQTEEHSKTQILYSLEKPLVKDEKGNAICEVSILVNGVTIETQKIEGINLPEALTLNFPIESELPESRSELAVDKTSISASKLMIDSIINSQDLTEENKITLLNTLYPVIEELQSRNTDRKNDLINYLKNSFNGIRNYNSKYLPNVPEFTKLKLSENVQLINPGLESIRDLSKVQGIEKASNFKTNPNNPYQLYLAELNDPNNLMVQYKNIVIINKALYSEENIPVLNNILANLGPSDDKAKGSFVVEKATVQNSKHRDTKVQRNANEVQRSSEIVEKILDIGRDLEIVKDPSITKALNSTDPKLLSKIYKFLQTNASVGIVPGKDFLWSLIWKKANWLKTLGDLENSTKIKASNDKRLQTIKEKINLLDRFLDSHELETFIALNSELYESALMQKLDSTGRLRNNTAVLNQPNESSVRVYVEILQSFKDKEQIINRVIKNLDFTDASFEQREKFFVNIARFIHLSNENFEKMFLIISKCENFGNNSNIYDEQFVSNLLKFFDTNSINELNQFLKLLEHDDNCFQSVQLTQEVVGKRLLTLFDKVLLKLSPRERQKVLDTFMEKVEMRPGHSSRTTLFSHVLGASYLTTFEFEENWSTIPSEVRPYLMYLRHGGEILKDLPNQNTPTNYQSKFALSNLVSIKQLNDGVFTKFQDSAVELDQYVQANTQNIDLESAKRQIAHSINNQGVNNNYIWIRELIQNSIDAASKVKQGENIVSVQPMKNEKGEFVLQIEDPLGMNLNEVINYLLVPGESSKRNDASQVGQFGQGFFTVFKNSREVIIKTSKGDGTMNIIQITPLGANGKPLQEAGKVFDLDIQISQQQKKYKGTTIQTSIFSDFPEMEATFAKNALMINASLVDANKAKILYKDEPINSEVSISSSSDIPSLGVVKAYSSSDSALTQNGLFIKKLDVTLLEEVPEAIREYFTKNGIVIDLPPSVALIQSRNDIAKADEVIPKVKKALPELLTQLFLQKLTRSLVGTDALVEVLDKLNLPYDFFKRPDNADEDVKTDLIKLNNKQSISFEKYSKNPQKLLQFILGVKLVEYKGNNLSLRQLADKLCTEKEDFDIQSLPHSIYNIVLFSYNNLQREKAGLIEAQKKYGVSSDKVVNDFSFDNWNIKSLSNEKQTQISFYLAFDRLRELILIAIGSPNTRRTYYLYLNNSRAHAGGFLGSGIGWNLNEIDSVIKPLSSAIQNNDLNKFTKLLEGILSTETHEYRHLVENSNSYGTHNKTFYKGQREILKSLLGKINPAEMLKQLRSEFPTLAPSQIASTDDLLRWLGKLPSDSN